MPVGIYRTSYAVRSAITATADLIVITLSGTASEFDDAGCPRSRDTARGRQRQTAGVGDVQRATWSVR